MTDEILRDSETYEMVEVLLYLSDDGHLTETPTENVAGVYTLKSTSDARIAELEAILREMPKNGIIAAKLATVHSDALRGTLGIKSSPLNVKRNG